MLFDLRGRGRRRTVQAIYLTLALLMGGGLVLFGIGGATNGGLVDALGGGNSGGGSSTNVFDKKIKAAEKQTAANPRDAAAWASLARLRFQDASSGGGYDDASSSFTDSGKKELGKVQQAWDRYLALNPPKPDANTALLMVQVFGPTGLNKADEAVKAMEVVIEQRPASAGTYVQYAQLSYLAGQIRKGDLAAARAVSLAPKDQRSSLKDQLDSLKGAAVGNAAGNGATVPAPTPPTSTTG